MLKILFIGDVVGKLARHALTKELKNIKKEADADLVIVNGENATHGHGITRSSYDEIIKAGADVITLGDHTFDRKETAELLDSNKNTIIRPANYPNKTPGVGSTVFEVGSKKILVINLLGRVFMKMDYNDPFLAVDTLLSQHANEKFSAIFIDMHAEATSEKRAMGWHLDGRVSAVIGSHTHVPTADAVILPQGTAYASDVGMVGARDSVIGVQVAPVIKSFLSQIKTILEVEENGPCTFNAVLIKIDPKTTKAVSIKRLDKEISI
jgi:2',3'-cyclic-nucleotide 2'-phosphodiesterase